MPYLRIVMLALGLFATAIAAPATAGEFPDAWYAEPDRPAEHVKFEGRKAPPLKVGTWIGENFKTEDMKGKIVVIDFWATWCGPCINAMPHNTKLAQEYKDEGVVLVGVCTDGDESQMKPLVENNGAKYPNAYEVDDAVEKAWPIQWYPSYAVVDRKGVVRAFGLNPMRVKDVIESLLDEDAKKDGKVRVRAEWLEGDDEKRARLDALMQKAETPPALVVENWLNSEALDLDGLKGKVVVLNFLATWCGPCMMEVPMQNELAKKYADKGLVMIGVYATLGGESLPEIVDEHKIAFPVCVDVDNKTNTAYGPNGFADYYLIDRAGKLRIADVNNASLEEAVAALIAEKQPGEDEGGEEGGDEGGDEGGEDKPEEQAAPAEATEAAAE